MNLCHFTNFPLLFPHLLYMYIGSSAGTSQHSFASCLSLHAFLRPAHWIMSLRLCAWNFKTLSVMTMIFFCQCLCEPLIVSIVQWKECTLYYIDTHSCLHAYFRENVMMFVTLTCVDLRNRLPAASSFSGPFLSVVPAVGHVDWLLC